MLVCHDDEVGDPHRDKFTELGDTIWLAVQTADKIRCYDILIWHCKVVGRLVVVPGKAMKLINPGEVSEFSISISYPRAPYL